MKTTWTHIGLWTLVLLLTAPRVDSTGGDEDVPEEFKYLEKQRSGAGWSQNDISFGNQNLQSWKEASQQKDNERLKQVAFTVGEKVNKETKELAEMDAIDHDMILQLGSDETVQNAAEALVNKETTGDRSKSLLQWDEQLGQFQLLKLIGNNAIEITKNTKFTVVGHGGQRDGKASVGGKTADQLSEVLLKLRDPSSPLHWSSDVRRLEEISIVSCDIGAGKQGETFAKEFLLGLREGRLAVGSVTIRTTKAVVQEDGSKVTVDLDDPELWSKHNPAHKRKFYLGEDGNLREVSDSRGRSPEWIEGERIAMEYNPLAPRPIDNRPLYYQENRVVYRIPDEYITQFMEGRMTEIFSQGMNTQLKENTMDVYHTDRNTGNILQETLDVRTVAGLDNLLDNIKDIIQTSNNIRRESLETRKEMLQKYGIMIDQNTDLADTWRQIQNNRNIRDLRILFNTVQNNLENSVKYYSFKDYIYSINMKDFYVRLHGATDRHLLDNNFADLKENSHVSYDLFKNMRNERTFGKMANQWVSGEHGEIGEINGYDGMAVIATHISEVVRNAEMFITNRLLWDLVPSWNTFRNLHPMTRGLTWTGNNAAIGMRFETADQNMKEQVSQRTISIMKRWITRKFRDRYFRTDASKKSKDMSASEVGRLMGAISEELPLNDLNIDALYTMPNMLSEDVTRGLQTLEETGGGKSLQTELQLKMMEDRQEFAEKINHKIKEQSPEDLAKYQKVKSLERSEGGVKIILQSKLNPSETKEILMPDEKSPLKSEELIHSYFNDIPPVSSKINQGLGIYGTLMGFQSANQMFAEGKDWEGGVMLAQGVHGVTELTGVNAAVNDFVSATAKTAVSKISVLGLEEATETQITGTLAKAGEVAEMIPLLSVGFTVFNIYEDLHQNTPIGIADAVLDGVIFLTALGGPELLPVTVALSIVRLLLDPLYNEIKHELDVLPPDANTGEKFVAVIKGTGLALKDVSNSFVEIYEQISFIGLFYNIHNLETEHRQSMDTVHQLQTAENYFKILDEQQDGKCHKLIDFTKGEDSAYGGNLRIELTDHSSMVITLHDPITSNRITKEIYFEKDCESVDLVMGIGEAVNIQMKQKSATVLWFIPVRKESVISSITQDIATLYGTYLGNAKPNRFYAVQQNIIKGLSYTLDKYHYELYGKDGNDIFFLGPQNTFVHGGNGQDIYYIPQDGGITEICNQADDKAMDLLLFNNTFQQIRARKTGNNLKIFNNNLHLVLIKDWFLGEEYRHMKFKSSEGILFDVGQVTGKGIVALSPTVLDFSKKHSKVEVNLQNPTWKTVVTVVGTDYDDVINGNQLNNVIQGRGGVNHLSGREGKDMYIIQDKGGCDTIDNFADDGLIDMVELPVDYVTLRVDIAPPQSLKIWDSSGRTCVIIKDWKRGWQWQHIVFKTKDFVMFQVSNTSAEPQLSPLILDYSDSKKGINIDLQTIPGNEHIMTVIGSPYYDIITGNKKSNFIQTGKGGGKVTGGDGSDIYVIGCDSASFNLEINNYAEDGATDLLYVNRNYNTLHFSDDNTDLRISSKSYRALHHTDPNADIETSSESFCNIQLHSWFTSESFRHLKIHTEDGITFSLPSGTEPVVHAVDNSRDTLPINVIDTKSGIYAGASNIMGPPRMIEIYGNAKDNYIDPGTNGASMMGEEGSDTYVLRKHYEGTYEINNFATDHKVDYLKLDVDFKAIQYTQIPEKYFLPKKDLLLTAPSVAKWRCRLSNYKTISNYRHLIVQTNDVFFTFSDDTFEIQPMFIDKRFFPNELHLDLTSQIFRSVPIVYGSLQKRNFISGNTLNNTIIGGKNTDVLFGLEGNDVLQGSDGKDYLSGGPGDDQIHGGKGNDLILGGEGDDVIYAGQGADTIYGGPGSDTLLFVGDFSNKTGVFINLDIGYGAGGDAEGDLYFGMENVLGTSYDDIVVGNDDNNYLSGGGGNDLIQPMGGHDALHGGEGEDVYCLIGATGMKMIDNFATDVKDDQIYIEDSGDILGFSQNKSSNDLDIIFVYKNKSDEGLGIIVKNWFISEKHRHLHLKMCKPFIKDCLHFNLVSTSYTGPWPHYTQFYS
ncbi:uncharacterized protein LOC134969810 [Pseudophryne corroboree]|uniref:uncharacterized protein LOC134969810 n=1 Tax=Pseudophryne corroboree TaxID=495146 RepID=UPI0030814C6A